MLMGNFNNQTGVTLLKFDFTEHISEEFTEAVSNVYS